VIARSSSVILGHPELPFVHARLQARITEVPSIAVNLGKLHGKISRKKKTGKSVILGTSVIPGTL
jgi:hypothetical protein